MLRYHFWLGHFSAYFNKCTFFINEKERQVFVIIFVVVVVEMPDFWMQRSPKWIPVKTNTIYCVYNLQFTSNLENWLFYDSFIWISVTMIPNGSMSLKFGDIPIWQWQHDTNTEIIMIIIKLKIEEGTKKNLLSVFSTDPSSYSFGLFLSHRMPFFNQMFVFFHICRLRRDEFFSLHYFMLLQFKWPMIW